MLRYGVVFALLPAPNTSGATEDIANRLGRCAEIGNPVERVACYDALAGDLGVAEPEIEVRNSGSWTLATETSPIDDSTNVYLRVASNETIPGRFGTTSVRPILWIRCAENTTSVFVNWRTYLGLNNTRILYRIDNEQAENRRWNISTSNEAVGLWSGRASIPFIRRLLDRQTLLTQVTPYGESPVMVTFDISGLSDAIQPLRESCNW